MVHVATCGGCCGYFRATVNHLPRVATLTAGKTSPDVKAEVLTPDSPDQGKGQQGSRGVRGWDRAPTTNIEPCVRFPTQREIDSRVYSASPRARQSARPTFL